MPNFILFRQWERRSVPTRWAFLATGAGLLLLLVIIAGAWVPGHQSNWAVTLLAFGVLAIFGVTSYRRSLRFNSLIIAKEFVVWETQCSQTWKRSSRFRNLDLPFRLKDSPLVIPVDDITNWSIQESEHSVGPEVGTVRIVLWRGTDALHTFFVSSPARAMDLEKAIRTATEGLNPQTTSSPRTASSSLANPVSSSD
jgi:hypothetical protein